MKKHLLLLLLPILLNSCKNTSEAEKAKPKVVDKKFEKIDQLQWLLGTWTNESGDEFSQETWSKENDSTYTAFSFTQVKNETVFAETMALEQKTGNLFLTIATPNQEAESPVTFTMIPSEKDQFTFENKKHDFPKRIIYTNPINDSLHAWIEGTMKGEEKKVDFYFSKKK